MSYVPLYTINIHAFSDHPNAHIDTHMLAHAHDGTWWSITHI